MNGLNFNNIRGAWRRRGSLPAILVFLALTGSASAADDIGGQKGGETAAVVESGFIGNLVVSPKTYKYAGFILPAVEKTGKIFANLKDRQELGAGETVYIDIGAEQGAAVGSRYLIVRAERLIKHPTMTESGEIEELKQESPYIDTNTWTSARNRKMLGSLVAVMGELVVAEVEPGRAKAVISESKNSIYNGDVLVPYKEQEVPMMVPRKEVKSIEGFIVAAATLMDTVSLNDIVYIDKGSAQNVEPGDLFDIYYIPMSGHMEDYTLINDQKKEMMPQVIGELEVVAAQKDTATAIIRHAALELRLGEKIRSHR